LSTPAEIILGGDGITSVSVDSTDGQSIVVTPVGGTVVSVGSAETQSISIYSDSVEVAVQSSDSPSVSISTDTISVEVATNTNAGQWPKRLRDLEDVVGDPSSGQVLIYNEGENNFQFADQTGGGGDGDSNELTDYAITVTNTDGAFSTIKGYTYEALTNMTDVLNDILNPYTKTSVSLQSLRGAANGASLTVTSSTDFEVGASITLDKIYYIVGDVNKVKDGSLSLLRDGASHQSLPEISTFDVPIDPVINSQYNSLAQDIYKITFVDNGNPNGQEYNGTSNSISLNWKYRFSLKSYNFIPTNSSEATELFNNPEFTSSTILTNDPGGNSLDFVCDELNATNGYYSILMYPKAFGTIKSVLQNNSTDSTADFVLEGEFDVTNIYGVVIPYYLYRTNDTGAYNDGITLTVTLN